jgi:hypothetical protein
MRVRPFTLCVFVITLACSLVSCDRQATIEKTPAGTKIDQKTIDAWKERGASFCWLGRNVHGQLESKMDPKGLTDALPYFDLSVDRDWHLHQLPPVDVPFGLKLSGFAVTDTGLKKLKELKNITWLDLGFTSVTDTGLKELKGFKNLSRLNLWTTRVTGVGLKELKELKNLATLNLCSTQVTDAGLKDLKELKNLTTLNLSLTRVTDAGLKELNELKNLTTLNLGGTQVTDAGVKELQETLPKCKIDRTPAFFP